MESSGTTTLARDLASALDTTWVPEYGREYWEERRIREDEWETRDFLAIAREQARREDEAAGSADRILVCDTDPLATCVWHRRYLGSWSADVAGVANGRAYALTLLTSPDFPFVQDGTRDGEGIRERMHRWFEKALEGNFVAVGGVPDDRLRVALELAKPLRRFLPIPG